MLLTHIYLWNRWNIFPSKKGNHKTAYNFIIKLNLNFNILKTNDSLNLDKKKLFFIKKKAKSQILFFYSHALLSRLRAYLRLFDTLRLFYNSAFCSYSRRFLLVGINYSSITFTTWYFEPHDHQTINIYFDIQHQFAYFDQAVRYKLAWEETVN